MESFTNVIVVVNSSNAMELGFLDDEDIDAVLYCPYTGQSAAAGIADIISGKANPSGRLATTFPYDLKSDPTWANAFVTVAKGNQLTYAEDIYVGYRWYETADADGYFQKAGTTYDKTVWRPFGYGLSYTEFSQNVVDIQTTVGESGAAFSSGGTISDKSTKISVSVEVKNTGKSAGKEVVQLYVHAPYTPGGIEKPERTLAAFGKTDILYPAGEAGEGKPNSQILTLTVDLYDIASYDCYDDNKNGKACWELDGGEYVLSLRDNAHTLNPCRNAEIKFVLPSNGFCWETDPDTGGEVENRFTGDNAEFCVPVDGSGNGNDPITYLSRSDFAGTFPKAAAKPRDNGYDKVKDGMESVAFAVVDGVGKTVDELFYSDVTMPTLNSKETSLYLFTREGGEKATLNDLNRYSDIEIVPNDELIMTLGANYEADEWAQLLSQMSYDEMATIVARCSCGTFAAESIGKPKDMVFDGPQGLNNSTLSFENLKHVSGFPAEIMLAQTFNAELARQAGLAMGKEVSAQGVIGMYAPAVDVTRHAFNGRNFEQFGEDPLLSGIMGAREVAGLIDQGVQCSVKHFVCSTPGKNPSNYNSWLTERTLREIYLKPFEYCVKDGGANYMMTSFNNIGGVKTAYSYALNTSVLRDEWGFKGSVITDYNVNSGARTTANLIRSGNDMRFQGSAANLAEVSESNPIDVYLLQRSVKRSLYSFCNSYYRAKTYNPDYTTTSLKVTPAFRWWIMVLAIVEILALGGLGWFVFRSFKPRKSAADAADTAPTVESAETDESEDKRSK